MLRKLIAAAAVSATLALGAAASASASPARPLSPIAGVHATSVYAPPPPPGDAPLVYHRGSPDAPLSGSNCSITKGSYCVIFDAENPCQEANGVLHGVDLETLLCGDPASTYTMIDQGGGNYNWYNNVTNLCVNFADAQFAPDSCVTGDARELFQLVNDLSGGYCIWNNQAHAYVKAQGTDEILTIGTAQCSTGNEHWMWASP